jgi:transcriptional/translational regulatory protein YebC/TACO1
MVDCLTDNKTRTVAEVRHAFSKYGGNMGTDGCVAFQFKHCGQMIFAPGTDEGALMDAAIEAGADDVTTNDDGSIEVLTAPTEFMAVKDALEAAGFKPEFGEVTMKPEGENVLPATTGSRCRSCSTRWKTWTTCRKSTPPPLSKTKPQAVPAVRRGSRHFDCCSHH